MIKSVIIKAGWLILGVMMSGTVSVGAQSVYPGLFTEKMSVKAVDTPVKCFALEDVELLPSRFRENLERDSAWMVSIEVDRLLHSFYNNSGVWGGREGGYMTVKKYGGWESLDCELRGHTTGHLLSAYALMYATTGADVFKAKGDSIVDGLARVQAALGNGYISAFPEELINRNMRGESVWAPWYTLHKIYSGLIDQYLYAGNSKALGVMTKAADWAYGKLSEVSDTTRRKMIRNEFGGVNEAFYNLYAITGDERYRTLAEFFYHNDVVDSLKRRDGDLGTKHTNTFIPKTIAEVRRYELTGDEESRGLAEFFWDEMIDRHTFATGCSSDKEHYFDPAKMSAHLSGYTGETCCTYNMLKLSRHLFCINPNARIADYYEQALYNHILGQQDPASGMVAYFLPLKTGTHRVYSTPENSFWCCVGSGFESHAKYAEGIYYRGNNSLYVNLFIPSRLDWHEKGVKVTQSTAFPASGNVSFAMECDAPVEFALNLRYPAWSGKPVVTINGRKVAVKAHPGEYMQIKRRWKSGDIVEVTYPMSLKVEPMPADPSVGVMKYGPVVLAGRLGLEGMLAPAPVSDPAKYNDYYTYDYHIPESLAAGVSATPLTQEAPLRWTTADGITVQPLYDVHRERYVIYWNLK